MRLYDHLPYVERPDLSPFLIHLTKNTEDEDGYSAFDNLVSILITGEIWASNKKKGFIKGSNGASCFMDVPFISLKYILNKDAANPKNPKYEPFGVVITKATAYKNGARPVLYLSNEEIDKINVPNEELWRVVRFEGIETKAVNWTHEREWRAKGNFQLPREPIASLVMNTKFVSELESLISEQSSNFKARPKSVIPINVISQGLPYL
ncbi:MAG: hypothetical protein ABSB79_11070 [Syntrophales bacterium]|jgi:hypothetical protein